MFSPSTKSNLNEVRTLRCFPRYFFSCILCSFSCYFYLLKRPIGKEARCEGCERKKKERNFTLQQLRLDQAEHMVLELQMSNLKANSLNDAVL